jgi:hypothetical protein
MISPPDVVQEQLDGALKCLTSLPGSDITHRRPLEIRQQLLARNFAQWWAPFVPTLTQHVRQVVMRPEIVLIDESQQQLPGHRGVAVWTSKNGYKPAVPRLPRKLPEIAISDHDLALLTVRTVVAGL